MMSLDNASLKFYDYYEIASPVLNTLNQLCLCEHFPLWELRNERKA